MFYAVVLHIHSIKKLEILVVSIGVKSSLEVVLSLSLFHCIYKDWLITLAAV